ncbi:Na/Pi cotransporter family protein [Anaerolineales bacterium HSG6]|nr:Na/Pi cotransporter family protein [Anaerolineales bacterium HSG6]MDM8530794.1 Na/Pi cotransporter family protein [Anaerolineales bacterium HSG25]
MDSTNTIEVSTVIFGLLGGLGLFLFGMERITTALKIVAGKGLKNLLASMTTNRFKAVFVGAFVTGVIQSSSVTTVLIVGFISAGLMTLQQSIGIILGADIGSTFTAQIFAFKVTKYGLLMIFIGFVIPFLTERKKYQQYGNMIMGLGLVFFGMEVMSNTTKPLRTYEPFINMMHQMGNPLWGILIGTIFTAIIQSSAATMGIVIVLATQGFITLEAGIALAFGANVGTCATALLASIGKPREAVQAAIAHVLFKVVGVMIWYPFIIYLASIVRIISPTYPELEGVARMAAETPRQIANAHTMFNVANTFLFIWFTKPFARLVQYIVPKRDEIEEKTTGPMYLDNLLLKTPDLALDRVRLEMEWLGAHTLRMIRATLPTVFDGTTDDLAALEKMDDEVDMLHGKIVIYLGRLSQENLLSGQVKQLYDYMAVVNYIERISDMIETNIAETGKARLQHNVEMSEETREVIIALHDKVSEAVKQALEAVVKSDKKMAKEIMKAKSDINQLADAAEIHLTRRLTADEPNRLATFRIESELIEYLKRMYYFAKRIARIVAEEDNRHLPEELLTDRGNRWGNVGINLHMDSSS